MIYFDNVKNQKIDVAFYKEKYKPGDTIELVHMENGPRPIPDGTFGKVDHVDDMGTIHCIFDNGRYLGMIPGIDIFRHVPTHK